MQFVSLKLIIYSYYIKKYQHFKLRKCGQQKMEAALCSILSTEQPSINVWELKRPVDGVLGEECSHSGLIQDQSCSAVLDLLCSIFHFISRPFLFTYVSFDVCPDSESESTFLNHPPYSEECWLQNRDDLFMPNHVTILVQINIICIKMLLQVFLFWTA